MNLAEDLAIKHKNRRDEVHREAMGLARQANVLLYDVQDLSAFRAMEFHELRIMIEALAARQAEVVDHDQEFRKRSQEALG